MPTPTECCEHLLQVATLSPISSLPTQYKWTPCGQLLNEHLDYLVEMFYYQYHRKGCLFAIAPVDLRFDSESLKYAIAEAYRQIEQQVQGINARIRADFEKREASERIENGTVTSRYPGGGT